MVQRMVGLVSLMLVFGTTQAAPDAASNSSATVTTIHAFTGGVALSSDGANPTGILIQGQDGNLYGITRQGGVPGTIDFGSEYGKVENVSAGAVFRVSLSGSESLFVPFAVGGQFSSGGALIQATDGNFYGVESNGLFQITPAGNISQFFNQPTIMEDVGQGNVVGPSVIQATDGNLYITTNGSNSDEGIAPEQILQVSLAGAATQFVNFGTPAEVFGAPASLLIQGHDGNFYGFIGGQGAIVQISPAGAVETLYAFTNDVTNGTGISSSLIQAGDGNLYGTLSAGGAPSAACPSGCGVAYRVTPAGNFSVIYSFGSSATDGRTPSGALIQASDGSFYGVTAAGGTGAAQGAGFNSATCGDGCGTLYRITTTGLETVLHSFGTSPNDGVTPIGALLQASDGNVYGVTQSGGVEQLGVVFKAVLPTQ
jgi:uncharacterized repeat protein (TIGR03803 family)